MARRLQIDRATFWEFKARCAELDLEAVRQRTALAVVERQKVALVDAFAGTHGFDAQRPLTLEDTDCSVSQD